MSDARLKTEIWIQACIRQANIMGGIVTVIRRGDSTSGTVLVKRNRFAEGCEVLVETRDSAGQRVWFRGTGPEPVEEAVADAYLDRNRRRDPDLWIIEVEDRTGTLPFEAKILSA